MVRGIATAGVGLALEGNYLSLSLVDWRFVRDPAQIEFAAQRCCDDILKL